MKYVVQQIKTSELSGVRYVAKEYPIDADTDE